MQSNDHKQKLYEVKLKRIYKELLGAIRLQGCHTLREFREI